MLKSIPELRLSFGPEALAKMQQAFDRACVEMGLTEHSNPPMRDALARAIVAAFEAGSDEKSLVDGAIAEARQAQSRKA